MRTTTLYGSLLLVGITLFTSCKKEEEETKTLDANKQIILPRVAPIPTTGTPVAQPQATQTITPEQMQQMQQMQSKTTVNNTVAVTKPGMNPPHGQPGHRCDISVGAPLNSKPKATATPSTAAGQANYTKTTITPNQTSTSTPAGAAIATPAILNPSATTTTTAPGMNPPHGQEGHQCGIAVGAPLPK